MGVGISSCEYAKQSLFLYYYLLLIVLFSHTNNCKPTLPTPVHSSPSQESKRFQHRRKPLFLGREWRLRVVTIIITKGGLPLSPLVKEKIFLYQYQEHAELDYLI